MPEIEDNDQPINDNRRSTRRTDTISDNNNPAEVVFQNDYIWSFHQTLADLNRQSSQPIQKEYRKKEMKKVHINGEYYDVNDEKIFLYHRTGSYFLKSDDSFKKDYITGELEHISYLNTKVLLSDNTFAFTTKRYDSLVLPLIFHNDEVYFCENEETLLKFGFKQSYKKGFWYKDSEHSKKEIFRKYHIQKFNNCYYGSTGNKKIDLKYGTISQTYNLTKGLNYTFGVEYECSSSILPEYISKDLNLSCVRDGSLNEGNGGPEYVTGVLTGDNGFYHLSKICRELTLRSNLDRFCGMHVHIGKFNFTTENLVYLYKVSKLLEDEIFSIVAPSRRDNEYCRRIDDLKFSSNIIQQSGKDYRINVKEDYDLLFDYIATLKLKIKDRKNNHPLGSKCGYNHSTPRYCWINFVPAIFNTKGNENYTVEIRIHQGTLNFEKTKNWILLWFAVLNFVENNKIDIDNKKVNLSYICKTVYGDKIGDKLIDYINERKNTLSDSESEKKEYKDNNITEKTLKELCV